MSYPEISDEFDPGFPRDSYDREDITIFPDSSALPFDFEIGRKHKKSKKRRSKVKKRSFKMPMRNEQMSQDAANQNQAMQPYGEPDYSDDRSDDSGSSYDTPGEEYDSDLGYDEIGRKKKKKDKHKSFSASRQAEALRKQREADKKSGIRDTSVAVAKAVKRLKEKDAARKRYEDKIANLEHEIERKDIDEQTRQKLEAQADEYEGMIDDLKESQRQELDEIRSNEVEERNPDTDPTFAITETDDMISGVAYIPSDDGVVVVGAEIHLAPIYSEVIGEFNNQVGNRFTDFFKKVGRVVRKIANNRIIRKLVKLAKGVASNPALASVVPGAGQMVAAAKVSSGLVKGLAAKNPKAVAIVKNIAAGANAGDPESIKAMEHLDKAAKVHNETKMLRGARTESSRGGFNWDDFYRMGMMHGIR